VRSVVLTIRRRRRKPASATICGPTRVPSDRTGSAMRAAGRNTSLLKNLLASPESRLGRLSLRKSQPAPLGYVRLAPSAYNARVDRLNAIRLLRALVAAGANTRAPMATDWVHDIAIRDLSLQGTELASAIAFAEAERWLADSRTREDWIYLTRTSFSLVANQIKRLSHARRVLSTGLITCRSGRSGTSRLKDRFCPCAIKAPIRLCQGHRFAQAARRPCVSAE
jgi:hypothetical protein